MKILYTEKFKEKLSQKWSNISLKSAKLRGGTNTGLTADNIKERIIDPGDSFIGSEITNESYIPEIISLPSGGIQISLDILESDQSFYSEDFDYQVILFFYSDQLTGKTELAFVCYEETREENGEIIFKNLKITTRKNIITIPGFTWECNLNFSQSEVTEFLESPEGNLKVSPFLESEPGDIVTKKSWESWRTDYLSSLGNTPWIETTHLNNYGIKIY